MVPSDKATPSRSGNSHKVPTINDLLARSDRGHAAARLQQVPSRFENHIANRKDRLAQLK